MNYRDLFTDTAKVWTTWSGPLHIDDFIAIRNKLPDQPDAVAPGGVAAFAAS